MCRAIFESGVAIGADLPAALVGTPKRQKGHLIAVPFQIFVHICFKQARECAEHECSRITALT